MMPLWEPPGDNIAKRIEIKTANGFGGFCFTPDSQNIAFAPRQRFSRSPKITRRTLVTLWDLKRQQSVQSFEADVPNNQWFAVIEIGFREQEQEVWAVLNGRSRISLIVWNWRTRKLLRRESVREEEWSGARVFSSDVSLVAGSLFFERAVGVCRSDTGKRIQTLKPFDEKLLTFSPNNRWLVGNGIVWDVGSGKILYRRSWKMGDVSSATFANHEKTLLIGTTYGVEEVSTRNWQELPGGSQNPLCTTMPSAGIARIVASPSNFWRAIVYMDNSLELWNQKTGRQIRIASVDEAPIFSPNGERIAFRTGDKIVVLKVPPEEAGS